MALEWNGMDIESIRFIFAIDFYPPVHLAQPGEMFYHRRVLWQALEQWPLRRVQAVLFDVM